MMQYIVAALPAIISGCAVAILTYIWRRVAAYMNAREAHDTEARNDSAAQKSALCALLRVEIKDRAEAAIARGYISTEELEAILAMAEAYFALGGNGFIRSLVEAVKKLPIKE